MRRTGTNREVIMRHSAVFVAIASTAMLAAAPAIAGERPARGGGRTYVTGNANSVSPTAGTSGATRNWGSVPQVHLNPPRTGSHANGTAVSNATSNAQGSSTASANSGWNGGGWGGNPGRPGKPGGWNGQPGQPHPGQPGGPGAHHGNAHDNGYRYGGYYPRGRGLGYYPGFDGGYYDGGYPGGGEWDGNYTRPARGYRLPSYFVSDRFIVSNFGFYGLSRPPVGYNWVRYYDDAVMIDRRGNIYDTAYDLDWDRGADYAEDYADDGWRDDRGPPPRRMDEGVTYRSDYASGAQYHTTYAAPGTTTVVIQPASTTTTTTTYIDEVVTKPARHVSRARTRARGKSCYCK
jgi:hypothetical protein